MHRKKLTLSIALALSMNSHIAHSQFDAAFNLSDLNGQNGFVLNGEDTYDQSGFSVSSAGDINGDGIDDLIIGATNGDLGGAVGVGTTTGLSYVVFGSDQGFTSAIELDNLNGQNGFVINGVNAGDLTGRSSSSAGDVNGDGIDDLIISAVAADPGGRTSAGSSYVVFGSDQGFGSTLDLANLNGQNGFVINGVNTGDQSGSSVSSAGDVNGDGIDDLIIGAPNTHPSGDSDAGSSYVVFGSDQGFGSTFELANLDGQNGFVINGVNSFNFSGRSVSNAGDVNGDGIDDVIIGAEGVDPFGVSNAGASYVVFGSNQGFSSTIELIDINGQNGLVINGVDAEDLSGGSVSSAGDVNGDGIDDVIIGADRASPDGATDAGVSYVVFGIDSPFIPSPINLANLNGQNGFVINGVNAADYSGFSVSSAGDVNGDGIDDVIIGATGADPGGELSAGASYVIFGSKQGFSSTIELDDLNGQNGFVNNGVNGGDASGVSVSSAGDVNGDGIDDVIIGASGAGPGGNSYAGASYVVFGNDTIFKDDFQFNPN